MKNLSDLREDDDEVTLSQQQEEVLIIGTVFKQQERKPSILKELSEPSEDGEYYWVAFKNELFTYFDVALDGVFNSVGKWDAK